MPADLPFKVKLLKSARTSDIFRAARFHAPDRFLNLSEMSLVLANFGDFEKPLKSLGASGIFRPRDFVRNQGDHAGRKMSLVLVHLNGFSKTTNKPLDREQFRGEGSRSG